MMEADITSETLHGPDAKPSPAPDGNAVHAAAAPAFPSALDRVVSLPGTSTWLLLGWVATFIAALALRLMRLDSLALDAGEAARAYDAWTLFRGQTPATGEAVPHTGATLLLLEGLAFFLFGPTDVVARLVPALAGLVLVALPLTLRRWVGAPAALGMAALIAISPTFVYASRVISPEIIVAALSLAAISCLARLGAVVPGDDARLPAVALGIITGAAYATGPSSITVALSLIIGLSIAALAESSGTLRRGVAVLFNPRTLLAFVTAAIATAVISFTRFLSYPAGITGAGETLAAWWQLLAGPGSGQPVALFLLALVIYEPLALAFAIVAVARDRHDGDTAVALCTGWAIAAFALWSFSSGRGPDLAVHVALPIVLLAGIGAGRALHAIVWELVWRGSSGVLALAMLGFVIGLAAVGILLARTSDRGGGFAAAMPPVAVLCLVVVPLAYVIWRLSSDDPESGGDDAPQPLLIGLLVLALLLGAYGFRSATLLAFYRADLGTELLAQRTSTLGTLPAIERFLRLSRDVGVADGSVQDPTGSHGLSIALERDVAWPYLWYFREFPNLSVVQPGAAAASGAQVAVASSDAGLAEAGYAVDDWPWRTTVPPEYLQPDIGAILQAVVNPARWLDVWRYLLFRDGVPPPPPATVAVGLTPELAGRVRPATGPFNLGERPGPGTEPGQFRDPIGVAIAPDGSILVVDSGNARVQRFAADGTFLDIWGDEDNGVTFTRTDNGLGPTGITITPDGTTWVADTWGHRVVAFDNTGQIVQTIGAETVDTGDDPNRVDEAGGRFFGPRSVAVSDDAIFVADTGNERIQKFDLAGTFIDAWGGYGSGPDQLIEPVGLAIGPDGNLYVADSGNARIAIFTPEGETVAQWPISTWPAAEPGGLPPAYQPYLAFDAAGNLYATASNAGQVLVVDREGTIANIITQAGSERLAQPIGVAITPDREVLFSDAGRDAVFTVLPPAPLPAPEIEAGNATASPVS